MVPTCAVMGAESERKSTIVVSSEQPCLHIPRDSIARVCSVRDGLGGKEEAEEAAESAK